MDEKGDKPMGEATRINDARIKDHSGEMIRGTADIA